MRVGVLLFGLFLALLNTTEALAQTVRPPRPASSEDLWQRWLELIAPPGVEVTQARIERLFGVPLTQRTGTGGAPEATYEATIEYVLYRYWYVALVMSPSKTTAVVEWSAPFETEESYGCIDPAKVQQALLGNGFRRDIEPQPPHPIRSSTPPDYRHAIYFRAPRERILYTSGHWRTLRPPEQDRVFLCQFRFMRQEEGSR